MSVTRWLGWTWDDESQRWVVKRGLAMVTCRLPYNEPPVDEAELFAVQPENTAPAVTPEPHWHSATGTEDMPCWCATPGTYAPAELTGLSVEPFGVSHPHFENWADEIDWDLQYEIPGAASVMERMQQLGFTVIPPAMPPFTVTHNRHPVARCQTRPEAEAFIARLGNQAGYEIREET